MTDTGEVYLKQRDGSRQLWEGGVSEAEAEADVAAADTLLDKADFVAIDVETNGTTPFWVIEIGAQRFRLAGFDGAFETLVESRAPINVYARRRHHIDHQMLEGAPRFNEARAAFLQFARGSMLVEHSHDAFDSYVLGRGLSHGLRHHILDTSTLARLVLDLPMNQTPGLARVLDELGIELNEENAHAALVDARATAEVFRELVRRGRERFGWETLQDILDMHHRPEVDRSALQIPVRVRRRRPRPS
jgi:DNA polymerase-3 subunit epsilon